MSIGSTLRITAEVLPVTATNRTVVWESSNTNVCIVDSNGLVEAVGTEVVQSFVSHWTVTTQQCVIYMLNSL